MAYGLQVVYDCPKHGLERFTIKIIKRFNMNPYTILPRFRTRPKAGEIKFLAVGRNVTDTEIEKYFKDYFREKGWCQKLSYDKAKGWWYTQNLRFRLI